MWLLWCLKHQPSEDSSNPSNPQSVTDGALHTYSWSASVVLNSLTSKWIHLLQEHAGDESSLGWTVQTEVTAEGSGIQVHRFPAYHQWPKLFGGFKKNVHFIWCFWGWVCGGALVWRWSQAECKCTSAQPPGDGNASQIPIIPPLRCCSEDNVSALLRAFHKCSNVWNKVKKDSQSGGGVFVLKLMD